MLVGVEIKLIEEALVTSSISLEHHQSLGQCSKKQSVVALSSCEIEYIASSFVACQAPNRISAQ